MGQTKISVTLFFLMMILIGGIFPSTYSTDFVNGRAAHRIIKAFPILNASYLANKGFLSPTTVSIFHSDYREVVPGEIHASNVCLVAASILFILMAVAPSSICASFIEVSGEVVLCFAIALCSVSVARTVFAYISVGMWDDAFVATLCLVLFFIVAVFFSMLPLQIIGTKIICILVALVGSMFFIFVFSDWASVTVLVSIALIFFAFCLIAACVSLFGFPGFDFNRMALIATSWFLVALIIYGVMFSFAYSSFSPMKSIFSTVGTVYFFSIFIRRFIVATDKIIIVGRPVLSDGQTYNY